MAAATVPHSCGTQGPGTRTVYNILPRRLPRPPRTTCRMRLRTLRAYTVALWRQFPEMVFFTTTQIRQTSQGNNSAIFMTKTLGLLGHSLRLSLSKNGQKTVKCQPLFSTSTTRTVTTVSASSFEHVFPDTKLPQYTLLSALNIGSPSSHHPCTPHQGHRPASLRMWKTDKGHRTRTCRGFEMSSIAQTSSSLRTSPRR